MPVGCQWFIFMDLEDDTHPEEGRKGQAPAHG